MLTLQNYVGYVQRNLCRSSLSSALLQVANLQSSLSGCHDPIHGGMSWWGRLQPANPGARLARGQGCAAMRWEAVFSFVEGRKGPMVLPDGGGLEMHTPPLSGGVATGALRLGGEPGAQNACDQQNEWTVHEHVFSP